MRAFRTKLLSLFVALTMLLTLLPAAGAAGADAALKADRSIPAQNAEKTAEKDAGEKTVSDAALQEGVNDFMIAAGGDTLYRPFTPLSTGLYRIMSTGSKDTKGVLADDSLNTLVENDDGGEDLNFEIRYQLTAGVTYYIGARYYHSDVTGTIPVTIRSCPENACGDDLTWQYDPDSGRLTVSGSGDMWNYETGSAPWAGAASGIRTLALPNGLTGVGDNAFIDCTLLSAVDLPDGVRRIGYAAFARCDGLRTVTVPAALEEIGSFAFFYSGIEAFRVPQTVSYIGSAAFISCLSMAPSAFTVDAGNPYYTVRDGVLYTKDISSLLMYLSTKPETAFTVLDGVTEIDTFAFRNAVDLKTVTIPDGVEMIRDYAFHFCTGLQTVTLAASVKEIDPYAFLYCDSLADVFYRGSYETRTDTLWVSSIGNDALLDAAWHYEEESSFDGTIEWNKNDLKFKGTTPYTICDGTAKMPRFTVKDAGGAVIDPSHYTYQYRENTNAGTGYVIVAFKDTYTGTARAWFKIYLPATDDTKVENRGDGIYVKWNPVDGAAGYVVYRRAWSTTTNGWTSFARWNNTTGTSYTDGLDEGHRVYAGTRYQYGVKAYFAQRTDPVSGALIGGNVGDNYNLGEVGPLKTTVRITTRKLTSLKAGNKQITASWEGSNKFTGYEVQHATDAAFSKNVKTVKISNPKTYSTTLKSLQNGMLYFVRVRSYHIFEGTTYYGQWSNVLCVKPGSGETVVAESGQDTGKCRALLIGENNYSSSPLTGCVNDMNAMAGMLKGLTQSFTVTTLPNSTRSQILNGIGTAFAGATDKDVSLFYYSGHGASSGALISVNMEYIQISELAAALSKVKGRVIVIMDSCHSGAAIGKSAESEAKAWSRAVIEAFSGYTVNGTKSGELAQSKFIVIAAAHSSQYSWDGSFDGSGYAQGAFTSAIIKGMACTYPNGAYTGNGMPADSNSDKLITLKELYDYAQKTAYNWTSSTGEPQQAQYWGNDSEVLFRRK